MERVAVTRSLGIKVQGPRANTRVPTCLKGQATEASICIPFCCAVLPRYLAQKAAVKAMENKKLMKTFVEKKKALVKARAAQADKGD